jgi:hypothetical protein
VVANFVGIPRRYVEKIEHCTLHVELYPQHDVMGEKYNCPWAKAVVDRLFAQGFERYDLCKVFWLCTVHNASPLASATEEFTWDFTC